MILDGKRSLAHVEKVSWIKPIENTDEIELIEVLGWQCICETGTFKPGDLCVYIEIDSKVPDREYFEFLESHDYTVKTTKFENLNVISQGIAIPLDVFDSDIPKTEGTDVTNLINITYSDLEDEKFIQEIPNDEILKQQREEIITDEGTAWLMKRGWGEKSMTYLFGEETDLNKNFSKRFPKISKTNQEFVENIPNILQDKTPYIRAQKCDGLSATYILEKVSESFFKTKYTFYIYSKNFLMFKTDEKELDDSPYIEIAEKYNIESKLKNYLKDNKDCKYVSWQGEICGPEIKNNPQELSENHLFCFQMTDSESGKFDIRDAKRIWEKYGMETIPIESMTYILPDDFEHFKQTADGYYSPDVCEGQTGCSRKGWIYYKTTDPNFSFENISIQYLLDK